MNINAGTETVIRFLQRNQIFENCTQMAIHSLQRNTQIYTEMAGLFVCFAFFFVFSAK